MESSGWMAELNRRLQQEPDLHRALELSTAEYVRRRDELEPLGRRTHPGGGPDKVKCLHAHTAHHLVSGDNPVGAAALAELGWADPERSCVEFREGRQSD